jgi:hypothetical protein
LVLQTLQKDGYCCLYFHPWEFIDLNGYGLPTYTHRIQAEALLERLFRLIADLQPEGSFITMRDFVREKAGTTESAR